MVHNNIVSLQGLKLCFYRFRQTVTFIHDHIVKIWIDSALWSRLKQPNRVE